MCCYHSSSALTRLGMLCSTPLSTLFGGRRFGNDKSIPLHNISGSLHLDYKEVKSWTQFFPAPLHCAKGMQTMAPNNRRHSPSLGRLHSRPSTAEFLDKVVGTEHSTDITAKGKSSEIIFLGTGTSEGIPRVSCLTDPLKKCWVCQEAVQPGNRNRRLNTSIVVCYATSTGRANILIDAGKFFYQSALRWFPHFGLRFLDAVVITHSHADAVGGLDDLRDWTNNIQEFVPIYVTKRDLEVMEKTHYYLVDSSVIMAGTAVSKLQFNVITEEPFHVHGLKVTPLPVWHGPGYRSLGFRFGNVCYISDVSDIPEETYNLLEDCELLILDALRPDRSSTTHFGLPRALQEVRKIRPKQTLFTGMMHLMDHNIISKELAKLLDSEGLDIQLSYDGLCVPVSL